MFRTIFFRFLFVGALPALAFAAAAQSGRVMPTPTPETPVRVVTEEVKLNVLAFDKDGGFAGGLRPEDLVITENNVIHQPSAVRSMPATVLIVMDTGGELRSVKGLEQTQKVANALVAALNPDDTMAVMQYNDRPKILSEWTTNKDVAAAAIGRAGFGKHDAFVKALAMAKDFFAKSSAENKHLVLITDGTDSYNDLGGKRRAMRDLLSRDLTVHVLSYTRMEIVDIEPRTKMLSNTPPPKAMPDEVAATLPNGVRDIAQAPKVGPTINLDRKLLKTLRERKSDLEASEEQLTDLAQNTNGEMIIPETKEEMIAKAALVADMIDASYVVTYMPKVPIAETGGVRDITVTSKKPGVIVEAHRKLVIDENRR